MNKRTASNSFKSMTALAVISLLLAISGCQQLSGYQTIDTPELPAPPVESIDQNPGEATVACEGTYHCEITKVDDNILIDSETHTPVLGASVVAADELKPKQNASGTVPTSELVPLSSTKLDGMINYYARVNPGKREIHVNFYPENNDEYKERFALIHEFKESGDYRLSAYRTPSNEKANSLLDSASPAPLCVELLLDNQPIRRFCKLPVDSRENEFIEVTGISKGAETQALLYSDESDFDD